jgi:hypothetical protein
MATSFGVSARPEVKTRDLPNKTRSFKEAFREARAAGDKTFMYNGKKYTTELAKPKAGVSRDMPSAPSGGGMDMDRSKSPRQMATATMADEATTSARIARGASERRAAEAPEAASEMKRESRGMGVGSLGQQRSVGASAREEALERAKENQRRRDMMAGREPEREPGYRKGGNVKSYAGGGTVRGAGAAQRGVRPCKTR